MPPLYGWPGGLSACGERPADAHHFDASDRAAVAAMQSTSVTSGSQDHLGALMHGEA